MPKSPVCPDCNHTAPFCKCTNGYFDTHSSYDPGAKHRWFMVAAIIFGALAFLYSTWNW